MTSYVITYRLVKGSPITEGEYDGSLHNLDDRVTVVEAVAGSNAYPVNFEINTAGHLDVIMSNGATIDAGALPETGGIATSYRGTWQPFTVYAVNDLFTAPSSNWLGVVLVAHTSAATFDWGANDGFGHGFYAILVSFSPAPMPVELTDIAHTLTLDDVNTYMRSTGINTGGILITIPADASVPIPVGSDFHFCQRGDPIYFAAAGGVTLNKPVDLQLYTANVGSVVTLKKIATDEWDLFGRLQPII